MSKPPNMVEMLSDQVDENTWFGSGYMHLWGSGSAGAHGYHWPDLFHAQPGRFDAEAFNPALYGGYLALKDAVELYEKRAGAPTP